MSPSKRYAGAARWALLIGLAAAPLAGCKPAGQDQAAQSGQPASPLAALALAEGPAQAIAPAPPVAALPPAPRIPVRHLADPGDDYAFADQAYALNNAFGDAPPDYGYDYDGTQPWVWRSDDNAMRVAEPLPDGGDRYYYYEPGADYPYLVRDPDYSYGYDDGVLVVIYDRAGRPLPDSEYGARSDYASRFYARGRALYAASQQQQRQAIAQANWSARRGEYAAEQAQWTSDQANDVAWRDYHAAHQQQEQSQWDAERARREAQAARFDQSINDRQAATNDWQKSRQAQAQAHSAPAPAPTVSPAPAGAYTPQGGLHPGGPPQAGFRGLGQAPVAGQGQAAAPRPRGIAPAAAPAPNHFGQQVAPAGSPTAGQHRDRGPGATAAAAPGQQPRHDFARPAAPAAAPVAPPHRELGTGAQVQPRIEPSRQPAQAPRAAPAISQPPVHVAPPPPRPVIEKPVETPRAAEAKPAPAPKPAPAAPPRPNERRGPGNEPAPGA